MQTRERRNHIGSQASIERLGLREARNDRLFDSVVRSLGRLLGEAYVSFSVPIDDDIQRHVATYGFPPQEGRQDSSICALAMAQEELVCVSDLRLDKRFADHHRVRDGMLLRSMLAVPVYSPDRWVVGVLACASDRVQKFDAEQIQDLRDHAAFIEQTLVLRTAAVRDELTGLYNRRFFTEQIDKEWRRATRLLLPVSYVLLDIDHFKAINDELGHPRGDEILRLVANILEQNLKRAGDTLARYGGEEFAMILPTTAEKDAAGLLERILRSVYDSNIPHPTAASGRVTVSAGVACAVSTSQIDSSAPDSFLKKADEALYAAKRAGRNRVVTYSMLPVTA